jgi:hypothetical protein
MPAATVPLSTEPGLPGPSKRQATCPWCGRECHSIVELIDHVDAAHLDCTQMASEPSATGLTEGV